MTTWTKDSIGVEWVNDDNGNKCSVKYFGTKERAEKALNSLKDCKNCTNCSDCSDCSGCSDCSDCSDIENAEKKEGIKPSYKIPVIENIHQKVLAAVSKEGAFDMKDWHICETTHCRAGWVVHLAGEAGYALEKFHSGPGYIGTPLAASLIYHASSPDLPVSMPRFYENNETAMADIKRLAAEEAATK